MRLLSSAALLSLLCSIVAFSQSEDAYGSGDSQGKGFLDPSRLTVHNSLSFGMLSGAGESGLKSQSLYTTMMQYKFTAPVTLNLNFGLPIHSTLSSAQNLSSANLQSMEYFKNMPLDVSLSWQPNPNMLMQFSIVKYAPDSFYGGYSNMYRYLSPFDNFRDRAR